MDNLARFDALNSLQDVESLRVLGLEAVELAKHAVAIAENARFERDEWQRRHEELSRQLAAIQELTVEAVELATRAAISSEKAAAERDEFKQKYEELSDDLVTIREVSLADLARMVTPEK